MSLIPRPNNRSTTGGAYGGMLNPTTAKLISRVAQQAVKSAYGYIAKNNNPNGPLLITGNGGGGRGQGARNLTSSPARRAKAERRAKAMSTNTTVQRPLATGTMVVEVNGFTMFSNYATGLCARCLDLRVPPFTNGTLLECMFNESNVGVTEYGVLKAFRFHKILKVSVELKPFVADSVWGYYTAGFRADGYHAGEVLPTAESVLSFNPSTMANVREGSKLVFKPTHNGGVNKYANTNTVIISDAQDATCGAFFFYSHNGLGINENIVVVNIRATFMLCNDEQW